MINKWYDLTEDQKRIARKIDPDSAAYQLVGKKCYFCRTKITRKDITKPSQCFESSQGHVAHDNCFAYIMHKYPSVAMRELEGKISRIKVEGMNIGIGAVA